MEEETDDDYADLNDRGTVIKSVAQFQTVSSPRNEIIDLKINVFNETPKGFNNS